LVFYKDIKQRNLHFYNFALGIYATDSRNNSLNLLQLEENSCLVQSKGFNHIAAVQGYFCAVLAVHKILAFEAGSSSVNIQLAALLNKYKRASGIVRESARN
jgi:hypothetical protein